MENIYRNEYAGKINETFAGKEVRLAGWVEKVRDHGGVIFLDLRDQYGVVQCAFNDDTLIQGLTKESTISVSGKVELRSNEDINEKLKSGKVEVRVSELTVLGKAKNSLPFEINESKEVSEDVRLKYRYLDLRNPKMHENIIFRTKFISYLREKMNELGHTEINTPILTASSPEGARDFLVPSRKFHGKFYALPQAPQIFKQLLMISGFDKYFQIAPCFRDEDARSDRVYGEFYQLDLEMAFATEEDVLAVGEEIFYSAFKKFGKKEVSEKPFRRIAYKDSMDMYGTDKPDLRNPLIIFDVTKIFENTTFGPFKKTVIKAIKVDGIGTKSNSWFNELVDYAKSIGMPGIGYLKLNEDNTFSGPIDKFLSEEERVALINEGKLLPNSVIFFIANKKTAPKFAGLIRDELGRKLDIINKDKFEFCIINDFPMYEKGDDGKYGFSHNPFSMPKGGIDALNSENLEDVLAYQFDFVCNGIELASGAVRNHDLDIMKKAFALAGYSEDVVKERFKSLYSAFEFGAPPHAGMAPGIDRMIMLLLEEDSIRETICYPLAASGADMMMGCPSEASEEQLREVHIKIR